MTLKPVDLLTHIQFNPNDFYRHWTLHGTKCVNLVNRLRSKPTHKNCETSKNKKYFRYRKVNPKQRYRIKCFIKADIALWRAAVEDAEKKWKETPLSQRNQIKLALSGCWSWDGDITHPGTMDYKID